MLSLQNLIVHHQNIFVINLLTKIFCVLDSFLEYFQRFSDIGSDSGSVVLMKFTTSCSVVFMHWKILKQLIN